MRRIALGRMREIAADRGGLATVEFALSVPLLLAMYLGGYALSDAIACQRKVTLATRAIADLTTRYVSVGNADVATVLNASAQVLAPYGGGSSALVRVSEIQVTDATHGRIVWSQAINGNANVVGTIVTLTSNMAATNSYLILGELNYAYTPPIGGSFTKAVALSDQIFMSPRLADQITHT